MSVSDNEARKIRQMLAEGKSFLEISKALGISPVKIALFSSETGTRQPKENDNIQVPLVSPSMPEKQHGDILLGFTKSGQPVYWNPIKAPNPHLMIVGESGFGKTYGITGIICELSRLGLPTVIVDYSRSYESKVFPKKIKETGKLSEIMVGEKGITLNPMEIRQSDIKGPVSVAGRIAGTFNRIYNIGVHQAALLQEVIIQVYRQKGIYKDSPETWQREAPNLADVYNELKLISEDDQNPDKKTAATTYSHLYNFFSFNTFNPSGAKFQWENSLAPGRITVLQLYGIEGKTQKIITEFLLWDIYSFASSKGPQPLSCFLVLDEAHNLKFDQDTPVDKIVREARKFGLAAVLASQQPKDFSGSVFGNTGTKICYQVAQEGKFIKQLSSKAKIDPGRMVEILSTLPKANAFILTDNQGFECKIASHEERGFN